MFLLIGQNTKEECVSMKRNGITRKWLSVLLAVVMVVTGMSVGFVGWPVETEAASDYALARQASVAGGY